MYCVIMGDIIDSRNLAYSRREEIAKIMQGLFDEINFEYANDILANFGLVRGDAFEGVLFSQYKAPVIIQQIIQRLYSRETIMVRISAVLDELSVVSADRNKADGPAFYLALEKLEMLRRKKSNHWLQVYISTGDEVQPLVDSMLDLLSALTEKWTDKQRELVWAIPEFSNQQNLLSQNMQISKSVVNRQLKKAHYQVYAQAWKNLEEYLARTEEALLLENDTQPKKEISYTTYYSIASRQTKNGNYKEAVTNFEKALERAKRTLGDSTENLIPIYLGLAESYIESIDEPESIYSKEELIERVQSTIFEAKNCLANLPKVNLELARILNVEGNFKIALELNEEALGCFTEALEIAEAICEADHPFLYVCFNNIGIVYKNLENYALAIEFYKKCMEYERGKYPKSYADTLYNMFLCYVKSGELTQAQVCLLESIEILKNYLPPNSPELINQRKYAEELASELESEENA